MATIFCLMKRPAPTSTLFPYTTLFRSSGSAAIDRRRRTLRRSGGDRSGRSPDGRDRKSTRLNSSHVAISYAAFCLKKKSKSLPLFPRTSSFYGRVQSQQNELQDDIIAH